MTVQTMTTKAQQTMSEYAGETLEVEVTPTVIYAFGSELACLRVFAKYNSNGSHANEKARVGYSRDRDSWYVSLDL